MDDNGLTINFVRSDELGNLSIMKLISHNFLRTVDDVFFQLPFTSVEDMNKALQEARLTEQVITTFTGRLHSDHDHKNARAHLQSG